MPEIYDTDNYFNAREYGDGFARQAAGGAARNVNGRMEQVYSVAGVNRYLNGLMKSDALLRSIWVCGEVSNYRPHYSGHMYFTLKDESGAIRCVMFRNAASRMRFKLENGQGVIARGGVSVFERDGQYQLYCEEIHPDGVGNLYAAYEQMKNKLSEEGLFDASRKKRLPMLPQSVCVLTSPTGSVIRDIINVSIRRFPSAVIKLYPVQVQGASAAPQIVGAIRAVNERRLAEVIIVARGGGSLEDLWAFNEEAVARAVAASEIPVVSAVGHETDYTICDFASDLRAPTPSAAAELVFPEAAALRERVSQSRRLLGYALRKKHERAKRRLERIISSAAFANPTRRIEFARMRLNGAQDKLIGAMRTSGERNSAKLAVLAARLEALNPLSILARGYAVVSSPEDGKIIKSASGIEAGRTVNVKLHEGALLCEVLETLK